MKILITGSSGLVGTALCDYLNCRGHDVVRLLRHRLENQPFWDISKGIVDLAECESVDAVVHLAGESIAEGRWNAQKKQRILQSRTRSTQLLVEHFAGMSRKPKVFISGSAIGFYGNRADETLDEQSHHGHDFVSEIATKWEAASAPATEQGIRVVNIRTGLVLSDKGGALGKMLLPFKLGLGGMIGDGRQWVSWIAINDMIRAIDFLLHHDTVSGPVNLVAPNPVTNGQYTKALGKTLGRPTLMTMPGFAARMAFGEMADELLLSSTKVLPSALIKMGFEFQYQTIDNALADILK